MPPRAFRRPWRSPACSFFVALGALPTLAQAQEPASASDPMVMYFDETQMVEVATRAPKPITQVAENVTIITAEEIEAMHAHSVGEILSRESGTFTFFSGREIIGDAGMGLLGTRRHQMLMLVDGVRINLNSNGYAISNFIPVGIIKRIEIIKGPASSVWGSSLGGVVNIITKDAGSGSATTGSVNASYGEANTRDFSADLAAGTEKTGVYLYGGNIDSDGLKNDRYSERDALYGKLRLNLPRNSTLVATAGSSDPFYKALDWQDAWGITNLNLYEEVTNDNTWGTVYFDTKLTNRVNAHLSAQRYANDYTQNKLSLGTGIGGPRGDLVFLQKWEDENTSFNGNLSYAGDSFNANLGAETSRSKMVATTALGALWGSSTTVDDPLKEERRGVYANATYVVDKFTLTPGLRYDYHSNSEEIVSPSLGGTFQVANDTLLRASVTKGFSAPYLVTSRDNPDLKPEIIWAYQAGIETYRIPHLLCKFTAFHFNVKDVWTNDPINSNKIRRDGFDIDLKTHEYKGLTLQTNFTYATEDSMGYGSTDLENEETYSANLVVAYSHRASGIRAELAGNYIWYNFDVQNDTHDNEDIIWDAILKQSALPSGM
ncbi:TonB-dependent receptor plug domain-containing protein [Thiovibrio sp. JS02]